MGFLQEIVRLGCKKIENHKLTNFHDVNDWIVTHVINIVTNFTHIFPIPNLPASLLSLSIYVASKHNFLDFIQGCSKPFLISGKFRFMRGRRAQIDGLLAASTLERFFALKSAQSRYQLLKLSP